MTVRDGRLGPAVCMKMASATTGAAEAAREVTGRALVRVFARHIPGLDTQASYVIHPVRLQPITTFSSTGGPGESGGSGGSVAGSVADRTRLACFSPCHSMQTLDHCG